MKGEIVVEVGSEIMLGDACERFNVFNVLSFNVEFFCFKSNVFLIISRLGRQTIPMGKIVPVPWSNFCSMGCVKAVLGVSGGGDRNSEPYGILGYRGIEVPKHGTVTTQDEPKCAYFIKHVARP